MPYLVVSRPDPKLVDAQSVGDVDHLYCCDPDLALCGLDLTGVPDYPEFDEDCALCVLVHEDSYRCPRCGAIG